MSQGFQPGAWEVGHAPGEPQDGDKAGESTILVPGQRGWGGREFLATMPISTPPIPTSLLGTQMHQWGGGAQAGVLGAPLGLPGT